MTHNTMAIRGTVRPIEDWTGIADYLLAERFVKGDKEPAWATEDEEELLAPQSAFEAMTNAIVERGL